MLQLSGVLEMQSAKLRRDALRLIDATIAGTATTMFWDVMESFFGVEEDVETKELEEAQSLGEVMKIHKANKESVPTVSKDQADSEDTQLMEEIEEDLDVDSVSTSGSQVGVGAKKKTLTQLKVKALEKYPLLMPIAESKVFYPTSQTTMHATGVDEGMLHHRQKVGDKGFYECAFDKKCEYVARTHGVATTHVRRVHLGHSLGCRFCPSKMWWQARYWSDHMDKFHADQPKFEALQFDASSIKAEEIEVDHFIEKEKFIIPATKAVGGSAPPPPPEDVKKEAHKEPTPKRKRTEREQQLIDEGADALLAEAPISSQPLPKSEAIRYSQGPMTYSQFVSKDLEEAMESEESSKE